MKKLYYKLAFLSFVLFTMQNLIACGDLPDARKVSPELNQPAGTVTSNVSKIPSLTKKFTISYNVGIDEGGPVTGIARSVAVSPDGKLIALGNKKDITLWDASNGSQVRKISIPDLAAVGLAFSSDGKLLAAGSLLKGQIVRIIEAATGKELQQIVTDHSVKRLLHLAFGFNDKKIIFWGDSLASITKVDIWDIDSAKLEKSFEGYNAPIGTVLSADNKMVVTVSGYEKTSAVSLVNVADNQLVSKVVQPQGINVAVFNKNGKRLLIGIPWQGVKIWDIATAKEVGQLPVPDQESWIDTSADDKYIYIFNRSDEGNNLQIWDATSLKEVSKTVLPAPAKSSILLARGGTILATLDGNVGTLDVWDGIY